MSQGLYSHTTRATGTILTAAIYNGDHQNHIVHANPSDHGGYSDNASQMREVEDPGTTGSENLSISLSDELTRLRFCIKRLANTVNWYDPPNAAGGISGVVDSPTGGSDGPSYTVSGGQYFNWDLSADLTGHEAIFQIGKNTTANLVRFQLYPPSGSLAAFDVSSDGKLIGTILATQTEAEGGSATNKVMTPQRAAQYVDHRRATQAEAEAGSDSSKLMTPLRVAQAIKKQAGGLLHVRQEEAAGTDGGTFTAGSWQTRKLNATKTNTITSATVSANRVTLPVGSYDLLAAATANSVGYHKMRLRNITDGATTLVGMSVREDFSNPGWIMGRFTITKTTVFELQHRAEATQAINGFGINTGWDEVEVYLDAMFTKVA